MNACVFCDAQEFGEFWMFNHSEWLQVLCLAQSSQSFLALDSSELCVLSTAVHCTALHCILFHWTTFHFSTTHCTTFNLLCTAESAIHCTAFYFTAKFYCSATPHSIAAALVWPGPAAWLQLQAARHWARKLCVKRPISSTQISHPDKTHLSFCNFVILSFFEQLLWSNVHIFISMSYVLFFCGS